METDMGVVPVSLSRPADGRVMCCICFGYFNVEALAVDKNGQRWDVCVTCWEWEQDREYGTF